MAEIPENCKMSSVLNLLLPLGSWIKGSDVTLTTYVFKLHYLATSLILFLCSILVTANKLIGQNIDCISDEKSVQRVINSYCWISSTFTIANQNPGVQGRDFAYQGVEPGFDDRSGHKDDRFVRHAYYQWVPFVLFLQAVMFYTPYFIWSIYEDGKLEKITNGLRGRTLKLSDRKDQCNILVQYVKETFHDHYWYARIYFLCDVLNLINVVFQMYFINLFLGGE